MITVDITRPPKLFRYSEYRWNLKSLLAGEFRLAPATVYKELKGDIARQDNELIREQTSPGNNVTVTELATGRPIKVIGDVHYRHGIGTNYYVLCLSYTWDLLLFDDFKNSDSCLIIHRPDEFCERVHFYAEKQLKGWVGVDAAVSYLEKNALGVAFSKPWKHLAQKEWRFAWFPTVPVLNLQPIYIRIGSIESIAEIVKR